MPAYYNCIIKSGKKEYQANIVWSENSGEDVMIARVLKHHKRYAEDMKKNWEVIKKELIKTL